MPKVYNIKIYSAAEREPNELIFIGEKKPFANKRIPLAL